MDILERLRTFAVTGQLRDDAITEIERLRAIKELYIDGTYDVVLNERNSLRAALQKIREMTPTHYVREHACIDAALEPAPELEYADKTVTR